MQGNPKFIRGHVLHRAKVIAELNAALKEELTAISQYFLHAEMKHPESLIERILFLDGTPNMTELLQASVGQNVKDQLQKRS